MRRLLLFSVLLLGTSWALAQNAPAQTSSTNSGQANTTYQAQSQTSNGNAAAKQTVEGCLSNSNGNYMLTAKDGTMYQLMGDSSKLSEHVGHTVKVTGTVSTSSAAPSGENSGGMASNSGQQTLQVSSVRHISKTCSGGGMSH